MRSQKPILVAVLLTVTAVDQTTKAWAWRHLTDVHINSGGDPLVSPIVGDWYRDPVRGAALDLVDFALLLGAWLLLARRRRPAAVLVPGGLALAGWTSNLLDRLGLHHWTAPGSVRGVVDFVPYSRRYWNGADIAIMAGSAAFALATLVLLVVALVAPRRRPSPAHGTGAPVLRGRVRLVVAGGVMTAAVLAAVGALTYAGVSEPLQVLASDR